MGGHDVLAAHHVARSRQRLERRLKTQGPDAMDGQQAIEALAQFRKAERERRLTEIEAVAKVERVKLEDIQGVEELSTTLQIFSHQPRPLLYVVDTVRDANGHEVRDANGEVLTRERPYMTDDECELAAIRHQLERADDYGDEQAWLVKGTLFGEKVTKVYKGSLSALRTLFPDEARRRRMEQAGAKDLDELVGTAELIERLPRRAVE
ncbi:hypothetical protein D3C72_742980 [compost metagenome]